MLLGTVFSKWYYSIADLVELVFQIDARYPQAGFLPALAELQLLTIEGKFPWHSSGYRSIEFANVSAQVTSQWR